jgi:hypothetical protein
MVGCRYPPPFVNRRLQAALGQVDPAKCRSGPHLRSRVGAASQGPPGQKLALIETPLVCFHDRLGGQESCPQVGGGHWIVEEFFSPAQVVM